MSCTARNDRFAECKSGADRESEPNTEDNVRADAKEDCEICCGAARPSLSTIKEMPQYHMAIRFDPLIRAPVIDEPTPGITTRLNIGICITTRLIFFILLRDLFCAAFLQFKTFGAGLHALVDIIYRRTFCFGKPFALLFLLGYTLRSAFAFIFT